MSSLPPQIRGTAFSVAAARDLGLRRAEVDHRSLARPHRGIRVDGDLDDLVTRCRAALATISSNVALGAHTAALLLGAPLPREWESAAIHVIVPMAFRGPRRPGISVTRTDRNPQIVTVHGLPVSSPPTTWCDLATRLSLPDLVAVGDALLNERRPLTTLDALMAAVDARGSGRGTVKMREALPLLDGRARSRRESLLRQLIVGAGIGGFVPNLRVRVGDYTYYLDLGFEEELIALEYQGEYHAETAQWRRDVTRRSRLESAGWLVIEVTAEDLRDPADLIRRIREAIARRRLLLGLTPADWTLLLP